MSEPTLYMKVSEGFRNAKTLGEIYAVVDKYKEELEKLRVSDGPYDMGNYNTIRECFKYYLKPLKGGKKA